MKALERKEGKIEEEKGGKKSSLFSGNDSDGVRMKMYNLASWL